MVVVPLPFQAFSVIFGNPAAMSARKPASPGGGGGGGSLMSFGGGGGHRKLGGT
jgi:hypothetical protein